MSIPRSPSASATCERRLRRPAAGEDRQPREEPPLRGQEHSWLQAIAPRSVRWRSGRSRAPPARSRLLRGARGSAPGRESGRAPPRARWPAADPRAARRSRDRRARLTGVEREGPAGGPRALDEQRHRRPWRAAARAARCSPAIRSSSRLVTRIFRRGAAADRRATIQPAAGTAARGCPGGAAPSDPEGARGGLPGSQPAARTPRAARSSTRAATGSRTDARSTNHVPSGRSRTVARDAQREAGLAAAARARQGDDPVRSSSPRSRSISSSRPTSGQLAGQVAGGLERAERTRVAATPGTTSWYSRAARRSPSPAGRRVCELD